jgi:hypothetical protein
MSCSFKLSRRVARFRLPMLAVLALTFAACNGDSAFNPYSSTEPLPTSDGASGGSAGTVVDDGADAAPAVPTDAVPLASASYSGGIPIGIWAQPLSSFGSRYNGSVLIISPSLLKSYLSTIRSQGGKVMLNLTGAPKYYLNADGSFSFTKWKQRMDRYKGIDFNSYIQDGTIMGHLLVDEPNDPTNWGGDPIPQSTVDAMGQYSKSRWPGMYTVVRTQPRYFSSNPRYIDAAWAQYVYRKGPVDDFIKQNVADAQNRGLALMVGLNILKGGPNGNAMTASQVQSWGGTLLSSSYPCGFVSWTWNDNYLSSSGIKSAMDYLRDKAESHSFKTCHGS